MSPAESASEIPHVNDMDSNAIVLVSFASSIGRAKQKKDKHLR